MCWPGLPDQMPRAHDGSGSNTYVPFWRAERGVSGQDRVCSNTIAAVLFRLSALPVHLVPVNRGRPSKSKRTGVSGTGLLLHTSNTFKGAGSR